MLLRIIAGAGLAASMLLAPQAFAATSKEKVETCNFGADAAKLTGAKRKTYMAKCTSNQDSPRGKPMAGTTPAPKH